MKKILIFQVFFALVFTACNAFADRCPYCGQEYGDPAPGDEARVYALRAAHEASCPARNSSSGGGWSSGGSSSSSSWDDWAYQREQQRLWEEQEMIRQAEERRRIEEARLQRLRDEAAADRVKDEETREELARKKRELETSVKGSLSGKLSAKSSAPGSFGGLKPKSGAVTAKTGYRKQEDYYKTLKTGDVPLPSGESFETPAGKIVRERVREAGEKGDEMAGAAAGGVKGAISWINKKKREFVDWVKLRTFDETFNQIPMMGDIRSIQQKTKGWYKGMRELVVGVYEHDVNLMKRGVSELATGRIDTGYGDDGTEAAGRRAIDRAGDMASDEIKGKGMF